MLKKCIDFLKKYDKILVVLSLSLMNNLHSGCGAIIGGYDNGNVPYAALVNSDGLVTGLTGAGPTGTGQIKSVAINSAGAAIIGGDNGGEFYAALVSSDGLVTGLTGAVPTGTGSIKSVAINSAGAAIIGGAVGGADPYVALVSSDGLATGLTGAVPTSNDDIRSVAINSAGDAIIGGFDDATALYVGLVNSDGLATDPTAGALLYAQIYSVAINDLGGAIIGGRGNGNVPYAALVSSDGLETGFTGAVPTGTGSINSVAINDLGVAIIGGVDNGSDPYAAFVSSDGLVTGLTGAVPTGAGSIKSVAINDLGAAIIGGYDNGNVPYAALVSPVGIATELTGAGLTGTGQILSVAINSAGCAIIGGVDNGSDPYAALVSPVGIATGLTGALPTGAGQILSVAISDCNLLAAVVPQSIGAGNAYANGIFALSSKVLPNHMRNGFGSSNSFVRSDDTISLLEEENAGLIADASGRALSSKTSKGKKVCCPNYLVWLTAFGNYSSQKDLQSFPDVKNWLGGAMLGFDYLYCRNLVLGFGGAYAYSDVDFSNNVGSAYSNQGFLSVYGKWRSNRLSINGALWGGLYRGTNERNTLDMITSKADIDGWMLTPHLEVSLPCYWSKYCITIDPFVMFDWANNWQDGFTETGEAGFNITVGDLYASMLRSEVGLRFVETMKVRCGCFTFEQKGSYLNLKPFGDSAVNTAFVGSVSSFTIAAFSDKVQSLGVAAVSGRFTPTNTKLPYCSLNYQGEFGSSLQNHFFSLEIGKTF